MASPASHFLTWRCGTCDLDVSAGNCPGCGKGDSVEASRGNLVEESCGGPWVAKKGKAPSVLRGPICPGDAARDASSTSDLGPDGCLLRGASTGDLFREATAYHQRNRGTDDLSFQSRPIEGSTAEFVWEVLKADDGLDHLSGDQGEVTFFERERQVIFQFPGKDTETVYSLLSDPLRVEIFKRSPVTLAEVELGISSISAEASVDLVVVRARAKEDMAHTMAHQRSEEVTGRGMDAWYKSTVDCEALDDGPTLRRKP